MMSRLIMFLLVACWLAPSQADAQTHMLLAHVDWPPAGAAVDRQRIFVAGWAFNCARGGQQPRFMQLTLVDSRGQIHYFVTGRAGPIFRPDVQAAYTGACRDMNAWTGVHLYFHSPPPAGEYVLSVQLGDDSSLIYLNQPITLVDAP